MIVSIFIQDGKTALHLAAEAGKSDVIRKLLNLGVEVSDRDAVIKFYQILNNKWRDIFIYFLRTCMFINMISLSKGYTRKKPSPYIVLRFSLTYNHKDGISLIEC